MHCSGRMSSCDVVINARSDRRRGSIVIVLHAKLFVANPLKHENKCLEYHRCTMFAVSSRTISDVY